MAELEQIFLQNAVVAAALLEDEAARPLREKLLAESARQVQPTRRTLRKEETETSLSEPERESGTGSTENAESAGDIPPAGKEKSSANSVQTAESEELALAQALLSAQMQDTESPAASHGGPEAQRRTQGEEMADLFREQGEKSDAFADADRAGEKADAFGATEDPSRTEDADRDTRWQEESGGAQRLLEELGEEGLWSGETAQAGRRLVRRRQNGQNQSGNSRQDAEGENSMREEAAAADFEQGIWTRNASESAGTAAYLENGAGRAYAEAESGDAAAKSGSGPTTVSAAAGRTGFAQGSGEEASAFALSENRSTEISGRDRMAEISRFFERDARRYGQ